jgi:hypothetical protein
MTKFDHPIVYHQAGPVAELPPHTDLVDPDYHPDGGNPVALAGTITLIVAGCLGFAWAVGMIH